MRRQIWNKPEQWLHNLAKAHCPSQLYLQLIIIIIIFFLTHHISLSFYLNFFFLLFSPIHTRTRLLYLTHWYLHYSLLNSIPSLWDLYTLTDTLSYLFMISSFFIFFYSHTQLISVFLSSLFSLLYSPPPPLSLSLSLSNGYPNLLSMTAWATSFL